MALSYGLTNPTAFKGQFEEYPDLVKFYTNYPTRSTESSVDNKRRPVLYTSLSNGRNWNFESQSTNFYWLNYGGNFYFNSSNSHLEAWAHKSQSSSYSSYKGSGDPITLGTQTWTSKALPYSTTNTPNKEICRNFTSTTYPNRYFCIKDGGGYAYNDDPWNTDSWTTTSFNTSNQVYPSDGGFRHICMDLEGSHAIFVLFVTNDSNKYIRLYSCNADTLRTSKDYTSIALNNTNRKLADYKYISIDYLPGVGFLIFYAYQSDPRFQVRILRTYDETTGERLAWDEFVQDSHGSINVGGTNNKIVANGCRGWYCPWTKEYFFLPNPYQVFWTKDGVNWSSSTSTGLSATTTCYGFLTDGINMVVAGSTNTYKYSTDKGTTWNTGSTLSPDGFYLWGPNDRIVIPFKCVNNLFRVQPSVTLGYTLDSNTGQPVANAANFYTNEYIPINSNTSYVVYGKNKTTNLLSYYVSIAWYDSSKNFISRSDTNSDYNVGIFTSPSNAIYARIRCNLNNTTVTQAMVDSYKWYFAKESDFKVMTKYGDIVCN